MRFISEECIPTMNEQNIATGNGGKFFSKIDWAAFWTATTSAFLVYFFTLGPSVGLEDSGELTTAADHLGNVWIFQCKRYASNVGNTPIQEVSAAKQHYKAQCAAVITNRHFTAAARQLAEENDILLIEREKLFSMNKKPSKNNCCKLTRHFSPQPKPRQKSSVGGMIILDDGPDD